MNNMIIITIINMVIIIVMTLMIIVIDMFIVITIMIIIVSPAGGRHKGHGLRRHRHPRDDAGARLIAMLVVILTATTQ